MTLYVFLFNFALVSLFFYPNNTFVYLFLVSFAHEFSPEVLNIMLILKPGFFLVLMETRVRESPLVCFKEAQCVHLCSLLTH